VKLKATILTVATISTLLQADSYIDFDKVSKYVSVSAVSSYERIHINNIEGAEVESDPVLSFGANVLLFPDKRDKKWYSNISFGYTKSFKSKRTEMGRDYDKIEQINVEIPLSNWSYLYIAKK